MRVLIAHIQATVELIPLPVRTLCRKRPRTLRIDVSQHLDIHIIIDGKVITAVTEIETAVHLITVGRHDKTAAVLTLEREETIGQSQRQRHILHHNMRRTEDHILARMHLRTGQRQIEMRMLGITGRIFTVADVHHTRAVTLTVNGLHEALTLLGINILDKRLTRLEVIGNLVRLILIRALLEQRLTLNRTRGILPARSIHQTAVNTDVNLLGIQLQILVIHLTVTIQMST